MPCQLPSICTSPGCNAPSYGNRCKEHQRAYRREEGSRHDRGLGTPWGKLRRMKLAADPFCQIKNKCKDKPLHQQLATQVDHIIPRSERPDLSLVWSNLQSACAACNSAKGNRSS